MENSRGDRYTYDFEGQLTAASYQATPPDTTPGTPQRTDSFAYDQLGNRKGVNVIASLGSITFTRDNNGLNQYQAWTQSAINYDDDYGAPWGAPGAANGVLMQDGWMTASFNALNQPLSIWSWRTNPSGSSLNFYHDPLGRCVKRTNDGGVSTYLYYDGWNLIQEGPSATAADRIYAHGNRVDEVVASQYGGAWAYHHYDARGHCTMLTNASGGLLEQYDYDAFGKPYFYNATGVSQTSSGWGNRFLFTGREWLKDIAVYDFRNRHYLPELGRFIQPDPKEYDAGDYNLYRYCHNDPVNKSDPFGLKWFPDKNLLPLFEKARQHVSSKDKESQKTFDAVEKSSMKVFVHRTDSLNPNDTKTQLKENSRTGERSIDVYWNPNAAKLVKNGSQSPALTLLHEASHAERFISDPVHAALDTIRPAYGFGNQEERRVILGPEARAAKALGETPRSDKSGTFYEVPDVTGR